MSWATIPSEEYVWVIFSCFSISIYGLIIYIIVNGRTTFQNSIFNAPFFTITLIQSVHELLLFFTINFVMRPRKFRLIPWPVTDDSKTVEWVYYWYSFLKNNLFLSYIVIAVNRMTVFTLQTNYKKAWSNNVIYLITCMTYLLLVILRFISYKAEYKFTTGINVKDDLFMFTIPPAMDMFDSVLDIVLSIGSGVICSIMYVISAIQAKKAIITGNKKKREMIILRSAFVTFLLMVPAAIRGGIQYYAIAYHDDVLKLWSNKTSTYFIEIMFVAEPWVLLVTFHSIRRKVAVMVGSIAISGSTVENGSSNGNVRNPMFTITR